MTPDDEPLPATRALDAPLEPRPDHGPELPARFRDLGLLGAGGMGEVRRVWDRRLRRRLAMKILRLDATAHPEARARFFAEARVTAGLQHPGIVAVHDQGVLADGRPWLTMREVRGCTFAELLGRPLAPDETPAARLRRHVELFARACDAVGFAHRQGVVHRDLKPHNLMIGELGDVVVLDWGIARAVGEAESAAPEGEPEEADDGGVETRVGHLLGSPGYIPPEQLRGGCAPDPRADVYALGVVLHEVLTGRRPTATGPGRDSLPDASGLPAGLVDLCLRALAADPRERLADARALADGLHAWLAGLRNLAEAEALLRQADALLPDIEACRAEAARLHAAAEAHLGAVPPHAPEAEKRAAWDLEDAAARHERRAVEAEIEWESALGSAVKLVPELDRAHGALAAHFRRACDRVRDRGHDEEALRLEARVRAHDRGEHAAWLRGDAAVTLVTDPPGATVRVLRYVRDGRRLVPRPVGEPLATPLVERVLPHGSYLFEVRAPGFLPLRYPVLLERGGHSDGRAPGSSTPRRVRLWPEVALAPDEVAVPAGWFLAGGDPDATDSLPPARVWLDDFAIARHPVTVAQYVAFLDDLVERGREADAERWAPREQGQGETDVPLFARDADGRFLPGRGRDGPPWLPDWPVTMVSWHAATAYAEWASARRGVPLRLPFELEWEKAARGTDGRRFPWGDHGDPTWARMVDSVPDRSGRARVDEHPVDESHYGVRGLGGNVRDWCMDRYLRGGTPIVEGRPAWDAAAGGAHRLVRGGCWASPARMCRSAARFANLPEARMTVFGFRMARPLA